MGPLSEKLSAPTEAAGNVVASLHVRISVAGEEKDYLLERFLSKYREAIRTEIADLVKQHFGENYAVRDICTFRCGSWDIFVTIALVASLLAPSPLDHIKLALSLLKDGIFRLLKRLAEKENLTISVRVDGYVNQVIAGRDVRVYEATGGGKIIRDGTICGQPTSLLLSWISGTMAVALWLSIKLFPNLSFEMFQKILILILMITSLTSAGPIVAAKLSGE